MAVLPDAGGEAFMERLDIRADVEDEWIGLMWEARNIGLSVQEIRGFLQAAQQEETKES